MPVEQRDLGMAPERQCDDEGTPVSQSYSAEHRRIIRQGQNILARVAIRAYLERHAPRSQPARVPELGEEGPA